MILFKKKCFVTNFSTIKEEEVLRRLDLNKISINSINFTHNRTIRGRIYTKTSEDVIIVKSSVYISWSIDDWKTLNTKELIFIEQCGAHKKYN